MRFACVLRMAVFPGRMEVQMDTLFFARHEENADRLDRRAAARRLQPSGLGRLLAAFCVIAAIIGLLDRAAKHRNAADTSIASSYNQAQQGRP